MAGHHEVRVSRVPEGHKSYSTTYKILIIGDTSVGKTALLNRFSDGSYHSSLVSTVGEIILAIELYTGELFSAMVCSPQLPSRTCYVTKPVLLWTVESVWTHTTQ